MSYIRALSNPEGLYIFSDGKYTQIWHNVLFPLASKPAKKAFCLGFSVPSKIFDGGLKLWIKDFGIYGINYKGFKIEEQHIYLNTGKLVPARSIEGLFGDKKKSAFLIKFSYGKHFVFMYSVTAHYIARRFEK